MSPFAPIDVLPLWALFIALVIANLLSGECGFRLGRLRSRQTHRESDGTVSAIVGSELGLLAFLLAFSFGIVASRFDLRRHVVLDEANAIGTTYLRSAMLPAAHGGPVRRLLREYVDVRIQAAMGGSVDQAVRRSEQIHQQLWTEAVAVAELDRQSLPMGLFEQSLNEMIDLHSRRVMLSLRNRMPLPVWLVLFAVGLMSFFTMGYQAGLATASRSPASVVLVLTFVAVIWLVADLDRPGEGLFRVSQEPMTELRRMMAGSSLKE